MNFATHRSIRFALTMLLFLMGAVSLAKAQDSSNVERGINIDYIKVGNDSVDLSRLNLFAEQLSGKVLYLICLKYGGVEKDSGVFCLRISDSGSYISPVLKRDGITFVTSGNIASQLLGAYIRTSEICQVNLAFRVEKLADYWVARVFEVGIYGSLGIEQVITDDPNTSLLIAGKRGDRYSIKELLKLGSHVDASDIHGKTALMYAVENGHSGTVKALLEGRASLNIKSKEDKTALAYARLSGKKDIVKLLEKAG